MKHFKENKDVAFYADKLCITSKYLTMVIKETSGKSPVFVMRYPNRGLPTR